MSKLHVLYEKIISVPNYADEDDKERRRRINVILVIVFFATIFIFIGLLLNLLLGKSGVNNVTSVSSSDWAVLPFLFALVGLYGINRYISGFISAVLLIFALIIVILFSDTPENLAFGRSLISFVIPIGLSALLLEPVFSYFVAGFISLLLLFISAGLLQRPVPNIPAIMVYFILAWMSHNLSEGLREAIKALKLAYRKLQDSESQYRGVFDGVNDAIIVETLSGDVVDVNEAACTMFGWSREEFLQKTLRDMVPPENHKLLPDEQNENTLVEETLETINMRANGEHFPVAVRGRVQEIGGEKKLLVVVRDITQAKEKERELREAKEAAEVAAQAKTDFLANMSHEIRTPLNAIYGMTDLMLDTPLNAEQQEFVSTIKSGSNTLLQVVNDILDFSKIEAGKMEMESAPFFIRECVEDALDLLADKAAEKMLDLAYDIDDEIPAVVVGDLMRLKQVLVNLLNNGVKFTDTGEVVVNVSGMFVEDGRYELTFSVRDTGIGIPEDKLNLLFKSFSQVDTSTTRKYGGTGLGLVISKQLAENMGGTMWVKSKEGEGSSFYFTIQVGIEDKQNPTYAEADLLKLANKRILIVDDNATNRRILIKQTSSWRMQPLAVSSGPEALALLEKGEKFDIAILDMQMPEMDGFTLAQEIAKKDDVAACPLVILTSIKREKARSDDAKISAFLNKPIKTASLFNILLKLVAQRPAIKPVLEKKAVQFEKLAEQHPLRILLAEDNPINQKVALKILSRLGYTADVAVNGRKALEALKSQTYDVVFMDIQMPEMDGDEATERIRAEIPREQQPYIIAMTAHALEGDREKYLERGMDDYVSKPIAVEALIEVLRKLR